jgi:hypothetical protein
VSRFNTLYLGEAADAADALADEAADEQELRAALQNALRRIDKLERALENKVDKRWTE